MCVFIKYAEVDLFGRNENSDNFQNDVDLSSSMDSCSVQNVLDIQGVRFTNQPALVVLAWPTMS
jgi:hypothetical protein